MADEIKPDETKEAIPAFKFSPKKVDDSWKEEARKEREAAAERAETAGLLVVMDRCWLKDFMKYGG